MTDSYYVRNWTDSSQKELKQWFAGKGEDVKQLQIFLRNKGYLDGKYVTGYFGGITRDALTDYMYDNKKVSQPSVAKPAGTSGQGTGETKKDNSIKTVVTSAVDTYNIIAKTFEVSEIPDVAAIGLGGDLVPATGSVQLVADKTGNLGVMFTGGFKGKSDMEGGLSVLGTESYDMQSVADLNGSSTFCGIGADFGEVIGISGDYSYSFSTTIDGRRVSTHSAAIGANVTFVPGEINTGVTKSKTFTFNAFDVIYDLYRGFK